VNYKTIPLLVVASLWYLLMTSVLSVGQYYIERYYGRGRSRAVSLTPWQRIRQGLWPRHVDGEEINETIDKARMRSGGGEHR
jgi:polar amino acid transport system permease protein